LACCGTRAFVYNRGSVPTLSLALHAP
jgi:hypothetical protein